MYLRNLLPGQAAKQNSLCSCIELVEFWCQRTNLFRRSFHGAHLVRRSQSPSHSSLQSPHHRGRGNPAGASSKFRLLFYPSIREGYKTSFYGHKHRKIFLEVLTNSSYWGLWSVYLPRVQTPISRSICLLVSVFIFSLSMKQVYFHLGKYLSSYLNCPSPLRHLSGPKNVKNGEKIDT